MRLAPIRVRPLFRMDDFARCEALQESVWKFQPRDLVPRRLFLIAHKTGGDVLGAFDGEELVGFSLAFAGIGEDGPFWHSHMTAVSADHRNRGIGRQLKLRQRDRALVRGLDRIEWTFDPLEIKNGYFNLEVLGAIGRRYQHDLYGASSSALQAGLPTDRITAVWHLHALRVEQLAANLPAPSLPSTQRVDVPAGVTQWKLVADRRAREAQARIGEQLSAALASGLVIVGYERSGDAGAFLLGPDPGGAA